MPARGSFGRIILLLILIVLLALGGLWWFDYLGVIRAGNLFSSLYDAVSRRESASVSDQISGLSDIDDDRIARRIEALDLRSQELDKRNEDLNAREDEIMQKMQELDERENSLDEREKTFNETQKQYENKNVNIEQNARYLTGMPPQNAVDILLTMNDQDIIDTMRMTEKIAQESGETSIVSYWLSLMPAERAGTLQRKMAIKPEQLY